MSISVATWDSHFVSLRFHKNLLFALDFSQTPCWDRIELFPLLVHCNLCIRNFHRLWHRDEPVHQIRVCHRSESFSCNAIFVNFWIAKIPLVGSWIHGIPLYNHTWCWTLYHYQISALHSLARCLSVFFTRHRGSHRSFHFFSSHFGEHLNILFVVWINGVNSSAEVEHYRALASRFPFLYFSVLSGFTYFRPSFWPYMIWSGSRLNFCQSLPMCPFGGFSFSRLNFVNPL